PCAAPCRCVVVCTGILPEQHRGRSFQSILPLLLQAVKRELGIASGTYRVGERLPPERTFAENLGVSRTIIREALIMLELEGLIEVRKGSGIHVIATPAQITAQKEGRAETEFTDVGPFELLQARQLLESHIAAFAATQVNKSNIRQIQEALQLEKQELREGKVSGKGDEMFHLAVAEATQNSVLAAMVKQLWDIREKSSMWAKLHKWIDEIDYLQKWVDQHEAILTALMKKQPEAARQAMWQHLEDVKNTLMDASDIANDSFDRFLFDENPVLLSA
ncbi:MAG: FCD domain-containing protein, partial [Endozoicomonas sp.]